MKVHELKCWRAPFAAVKAGTKTHEVRKNDRDFVVGDELLLREYDPSTGAYSGACQRVIVTYISDAGTFGLPPDLCVMSIRKGGAA